MRTPARRRLILALGFAIAPGIAAAATQEQIGSWILSCPADRQPCLMRLNRRFIDEAGVTGDLEIQAHGTTLLPVIALRGLSSEALAAATMAGKTEASLQFPGGAREKLACAAVSAYLCVPDDEAAQKLAARLPLARSVTVRVAVTVTGMGALPAQERSLDLSGTADALARLRVAGPTQVPGPLAALTSPSPAGLIGLADKALKAAGYPNGAADLQALVAKYLRK